MSLTISYKLRGIFFLNEFFVIIECTYLHFQTSSNCPACGKSLGANDFKEVVVAGPSPSLLDTFKNTLQTLFTKLTSNFDSICPKEMCSRLLSHIDDSNKATRFVLKQFIFDCENRGQATSKMTKENEYMRKEITTLKQTSSTLRIQLEQTIADLQHRDQGFNGTVKEMQKQLDEKDLQIRQFRQLVAKDGMARLPGSGKSPSSSENRGDFRDGYDFGGGAAHNNRREHDVNNRRPLVSSSSTNHSATPPLQGLMFRQQAKEVAKTQGVGDFSRTRIRSVMEAQQRPESRLAIDMTAGHSQLHSRSARQSHHQDIDSVITPIQIPNSSSGYSRIASSRMSPLNADRSISPAAGTSLPGTPRIRDLTASSGYMFTSRSNRPTNTNALIGDHTNGMKRNRSISPAEARQYQEKGPFGLHRNGPRY